MLSEGQLLDAWAKYDEAVLARYWLMYATGCEYTTGKQQPWTVVITGIRYSDTTLLYTFDGAVTLAQYLPEEFTKWVTLQRLGVLGDRE